MSPKNNYVSKELRSLVATRAHYLCEYCLIHEDDTFLGCAVDHIISLKHGGPTVPENLAYACPFCNRYKGSDIASLSREGGGLVRFFNQRIDRWGDVFRLDKSAIQPLSDIGEVTARILKFNESERILERERLAEIGRYPSREALEYLHTDL
ncbi:MAG TPA: HNH endonuclease signature motif containing protein [Blastocatellia bacterium]